MSLLLLLAGAARSTYIRPMVISATYWANSGKLDITIQNPNPVVASYIQNIYLERMMCSNVNLIASAEVIQITADCPRILVVPGSIIRGEIESVNGTIYPFAVQVRS